MSPKLEDFSSSSTSETPLSSLAHRVGKLSGSNPRLSSSLVRSPTSAAPALGIRARLNSLGQNSRQFKKTTSSSTLTVQDPTGVTRSAPVSARPHTPSPASSEEGTDSEEDKEAEVDKALEEQESLDQKLQQLQNMMTRDALGLVSDPSHPPYRRSHPAPHSQRSQSLSSHTSSLQNSIPDMPTPDSQPHSPMHRALSPSKSSSPAMVSSGSAKGHHSQRGRHNNYQARSSSEHSSVVSSASSFSDLSGE